MKKVLPLILILSFCLISLAGCTPDTSEAGKDEFVYNSGGFTLYVPESWTVTLSTDCTVANAPDGTTVSVTPFSMSDAYYQTVSTAWEKIKSNFDTFFAGNYSIVDEENTDFEVIVDGYNAGEYIYTGTVADVSMKYKTVLTIYNTYLYIITFSTTPELYDSHEEDYTNIIKYFKFAKPTTPPEGFKACDKPDNVEVKNDKFTMKVDSEWITDNSTGVLFARYANGFPSCISVVIGDMKGFDNAQDYWNSYLETFKSSLKQFTIIENECSDDSTVAGKPAYSYVFTAIPAVDDQGEDMLYKYCQVLIPVGEEVYIITYSSSANTELGTGYYDTHYDVFIDVLANFQINY